MENLEKNLKDSCILKGGEIVKFGVRIGILKRFDTPLIGIVEVIELGQIFEVSVPVLQLEPFSTIKIKDLTEHPDPNIAVLAKYVELLSNKIDVLTRRS